MRRQARRAIVARLVLLAVLLTIGCWGRSEPDLGGAYEGFASAGPAQYGT